MNWNAVLQNLYRQFPRENDSPLNFLPVEKNLQKILGLTKTLFVAREKDGWISSEGKGSFSAEEQKAVFRGLNGRRKPFVPGKKTLPEWMEFWPVFPGRDWVAFYALGWKRDRKRFSAEEKQLLELLVDRTALFLERNRLWKCLERAQRLSSLGFLSAAMIHEIRNPLTALDTLVQLLPHKKGDERFMESFQTLMIREIGRLGHLTETYLDFSRQKIEKFEKIDLQEPIQHVIEILKPLFTLKKVRLITMVPRGLFIRGDVHQMEGLIMNLAQNALQAAGTQGVVKITAGFSDSKNPGPGSWIKLRVDDDGPSVSRENKNKIFDPFFTTKEEGTGLGLAICRRIIENHGGFSTAKSFSEKGFQFNVLFPALKKPSK